MFKFCLLLALAISCASGQETATSAQPSSGNSDGSEGAPEPYAYAYETDSHAASEQKDENGKVTGFYTLTDADGRARRVEYYADESGFHAKVQTNEVGTKSESPADVQILASPPTAEQSVYHAPAQQQYQAIQQQAPQVYQFSQQVPQQQTVTYQYQPGVSGASYFQQPGYSYGYQGYQYNPGVVYQYPGVTTTTTSSSGSYGVTNGAVYGGYNYHVPASYYAARSSGVINPGSVTISRYSTGPSVYRNVRALNKQTNPKSL